MRYNKRATVIRTIEKNGPFGLDEEEVAETLPCYSQNISIDEAATIYGGSITEGLKLHFQHKVDNVDTVFFNGVSFDVIAERHFRRSTVLFLERSGHNVRQ